MKKTITILICLVVTSNLAFCQQGIDFNFDQDTNYKKYFYIDSNDVNNIWQIGKPNKSVVNVAYSIPNCLASDTTNPYPPNNNSSLYFRHIMEWDMFSNVVNVCFKSLVSTKLFV